MDATLARFLWVCLGGAAGSGCRWLLSEVLTRKVGPGFPYGTFAVNVTGSFLIGALMVVGVERAAISPTLRLTLGVGVLGGFTTYSTFNYETIEFARSGAWGLAIANVALTTAACLAAGLLGAALARWAFA